MLNLIAVLVLSSTAMAAPRCELATGMCTTGLRMDDPICDHDPGEDPPLWGGPDWGAVWDYPYQSHPPCGAWQNFESSCWITATNDYIAAIIEAQWKYRNCVCDAWSGWLGLPEIRNGVLKACADTLRLEVGGAGVNFLIELSSCGCVGDPP